MASKKKGNQVKSKSGAKKMPMGKMPMNQKMPTPPKGMIGYKSKG